MTLHVNVISVISVILILIKAISPWAKYRPSTHVLACCKSMELFNKAITKTPLQASMVSSKSNSLIGLYHVDNRPVGLFMMYTRSIVTEPARQVNRGAWCIFVVLVRTVPWLAAVFPKLMDTAQGYNWQWLADHGMHGRCLVTKYSRFKQPLLITEVYSVILVRGTKWEEDNYTLIGQLFRQFWRVYGNMIRSLLLLLLLLLLLQAFLVSCIK